jgi:hypothetical protein
MGNEGVELAFRRVPVEECAGGPGFEDLLDHFVQKVPGPGLEVGIRTVLSRTRSFLRTPLGQ